MTPRIVALASSLLFLFSQAQAQEAPPPAATPSAAQEAPTPPKEQPPFAMVGDEPIPLEEFSTFLRQQMQKKYYHGKVPEAEFARFQREMGENLVIRHLLLKEAKARGLTPNQEEIKKKVEAFDQRYGNSPNWQKNREQMLASVTPELEKQSLLAQLEESVRAVPEPTTQEAKAFYDSNPKLFTEPESQDLGVILLRVDPSSGAPAWTKAKEEATELVTQLRAGADFAEMARIRSGDEASAAKGGQMGFMHKGSISTEAEKVLEKMQPGEISDPLTVLEGVAIFKLNQRQAAVLTPFSESMEKRAKGHLRRERTEQAWNGLKEKLRKEAKVSIREAYYLPLVEEKTESKPPQHPMGGAMPPPPSSKK